LGCPLQLQFYDIDNEAGFVLSRLFFHY